MRRIALVAIALTLAGCASGTGAEPNATTTGDWQLVEFTDHGETVDLTGTAITLTIGDGKAGGRTPCNSYFATMPTTRGAHTITGIGQTEVACVDPALMDLEARYLGALAAVDDIELDGPTLLLSGSGIHLTYQPVEPPTDLPLVDTAWILTTVTDGPGADASASSVIGTATITFGKDGRVEGHAGCRTFEGTYRLEDGVIGAEITKAAADCPAEYVPQEEAQFDLLSGEFEASISGNTLVLSQPADGISLEYRSE